MAFFRLNDICHIAKGKTPISKAVKGDYPLVTTSEDRLSSEAFDFDGKYVCVPMVSSTGHGHASLKRLQYQEGRFALGTILVGITPKDHNIVIAKYLYVYLTVFKDELIVPLMKGSANVSLTLHNLSTVKIFIPDFEKQVEVIEAFNTCNKYFYNFEQVFIKQLDTLKIFRSKVLQDAFGGRLFHSNFFQNVSLNTRSENTNRAHDSPQHWDWFPIRELVRKIGAGSTPKGGKTVYKRTGVIFLRSQNVQNGYLDLEDVAYISDEINLKMKGTQIEGLDILLNITGASLGRTTVVPYNFPKANVSQHVAILRLRDTSLSDFLHLYLLSPYFQNKIQLVQSGISREGLSIRELQKIFIPIPPLDERIEILKKVNELFLLHQQLTDEFFKSVGNADGLLIKRLKEALNLNDEVKTYLLTSPFKFRVSDSNRRKKTMQQPAPIIENRYIDEINLDVLIKEYQYEAFTFSDVFEKTKLDYESVKESIFQLLTIGKNGKKPYLKVFFDENTSRKMFFKIIEK